LIWCAIFFILTADDPDSHRFIKEHERKYILRETKKPSNLVIL